MTKVFISYSHDSNEHRDFVRGISDRMRREDGLDCQIDQYIIGSPPEGWQRWMENQIEQADFVLLVCTPNYLKRYRGEEREGGRGVTFEGVVISQTLYDHYYRNTKFIPVIPENGSLDHVPLPLKGYSCYFLPADYDKLYRVLTGQAEYVAPPLGQIRLMPVANAETPKRIRSDRLPTVKGDFFGREAELKLLDDAWAGNGTRIIQFIAPGGTGKTKLLRHWLDHANDIDALIAWSFYSQGSSEDKQVSATPFFSHAFEKLGSTRSLSSFANEEDKGEHLADLLRQQRCVLVLDGLEPLQHAGKGMRNELKDRAVRRLLRSLAGQNNGLCIITTRIAVPELTNRPSVVSHDLQNLVVDDGVKLLQSLGVKGSGEELEKAVKEYGCHALALSLLGNALHTYLDDDVRKRDTLTELIGDYDDLERHAFKVMQAYSIWLDGTPELKLLQLLGLFDHPIETEVLQVLWQAQIPDLTANIDEKSWKVAIRDLREKHRLLSVHDNRSGLLDCHPLIREYFGRQLQEKQPEVWRQAHTRLYEYYKTLPKKEFPDTLEEMQPLFNAVAHGCAAGLYQQALKDVYLPRIKRNYAHFLTKKLGAYSDDLAVVANFFSKPWSTPASELSEELQASVLSWAGFRLNALGRLLDLFIEAEKFQRMQHPKSPHLFSRPGFYYCDFLLAQNRTREVMRRARYALNISLNPQMLGISNMGLLDVALDRLTIGRAYLQQRNFLQAAHWLDQAVANLYEAGSQDDLPRGLLARAALYRDIRNPNHDFTRTHQDLQEVHEIAEPSGMRLHLTDYHLEMARLLIAEKENPSQSPFFKGGSQGSDVVVIPPLEKGGPGGRISVQEHVTRAEKLIEETGYKRRLPELQALQKIIGEQSFS